MTEIEYFKSSIHKCPDGRYRVDYSYRSPEDGQRHRTCKRGFKLQRDATKWQREELPNLIRKLSMGRQPDEEMTMTELAKEYMEFTKIRRRASTADIKENIFDTKILPFFGDKKVYEISKNDVRGWQDQLLTQTKSDGKPYSTTYLRTINNQELICKGWFLPPNTYDCGSFVVNGTAVIGKELKFI